jgi:hypothetical protein
VSAVALSEMKAMDKRAALKASKEAALKKVMADCRLPLAMTHQRAST